MIFMIKTFNVDKSQCLPMYEVRSAVIDKNVIYSFCLNTLKTDLKHKNDIFDE